MKLYIRIKNWCNANQGVLSLIAIIIMLISLIPENLAPFTFKDNFFQKIASVFVYKIKFPVYAVLVLIPLIAIYLNKYRKKYSTTKYSNNLLVGTWKNDWGKGNEICDITSDGKYYVNNEHCFNVSDLKIDTSTGSISFLKVAVRPNDNRRLFAELKILNNSKLEGKENDNKISYTRIY